MGGVVSSITGKGGAPSAPSFNGVDQMLLNRIGNQQLPSGEAARDQAITAAYDQATSRLDPQWAQQGEGLSASLANQGLSIGDEAYQTAQDNFGRARNDAYAQAMRNAIGQGTMAGSAIFNQGVQSAMLPYQQFGLATGPMMQRFGAEMQGYGANQAGKNSLLNAGSNLAAIAMMA